MFTFPRFLFGTLFLVLLVACSTTTPTSEVKPLSTQFSQPVPQVDEIFERPPTFTALPSNTPLPSTTPDQTQTAISQAIVLTQTANQMFMASFPRLCKDNYSPRNFSPNKLWMVEFCYSEDDKSPILTLSNKDTQDLWKLVYRNYIPQAESLPDGGLSIVHWSDDGRYAYFNSYMAASGGYCFAGGNVLNGGWGLFRVDLQSGNTITILPLNDNFGWYGFSFSPTDRRLTYGAYARDLKILDLKTGQLINIIPANDFSEGGGYVWSSDGLEFVYSTVLDNEISEPITYSLRFVDAQTGSERILLESPDNCFAARSWANNNILTIESYDRNYDRTLIEYDLNSNKIVSEATATSFP